MASGTLKVIAGPAYLANSATDVYTPPASTIFTVIKQITVANKTASAATFTLYRGATGASTGGTELVGLSKSVPANDYIQITWHPGLKMESTNFLVGVASAASTLVITVIGEQVVV